MVEKLRAYRQQGFEIVICSARTYTRDYQDAVAIWDEAGTNILLGRKEHSKQWRLVGGFVDPTDASFAAAARREVSEETGLAITDPQFIASARIDDWRYRGEPDGIMSALFSAKVQFGSPKPNDDIAALKWFNITDLADAEVFEREIVPTHHEILTIALNHQLKRLRPEAG